eukprot:10166-Heterococcus_DN1.PRE.4
MVHAASQCKEGCTVTASQLQQLHSNQQQALLHAQSQYYCLCKELCIHRTASAECARVTAVPGYVILDIRSSSKNNDLELSGSYDKYHNNILARYAAVHNTLVIAAECRLMPCSTLQEPLLAQQPGFCRCSPR